MNKIVFFVFQIFLLASDVHAGSFPSVWIPGRELVKSISEGLLNSKKIQDEAKRRNQGYLRVLASQKSYLKTISKRRERIKELRQKVLESSRDLQPTYSKTSQELETELLDLLALCSLREEESENNFLLTETQETEEQAFRKHATPTSIRKTYNNYGGICSKDAPTTQSNSVSEQEIRQESPSPVELVSQPAHSSSLTRHRSSSFTRSTLNDSSKAIIGDWFYIGDSGTLTQDILAHINPQTIFHGALEPRVNRLIDTFRARSMTITTKIINLNLANNLPEELRLNKLNLETIVLNIFCEFSNQRTVFLICQDTSYSVVIAISYLMLHHQLDLISAINWLETSLQQINIKSGFIQQLLNLELRLRHNSEYFLEDNRQRFAQLMNYLETHYGFVNQHSVQEIQNPLEPFGDAFGEDES